MRRPPNRPPRDLVQRREEQAWALRLQGRTEAEIAAALGVTQGAVSKILHRVERQALRRLTREAALLKVVQLAQLEHIVDEAMRAWAVSLEDSVTVQGFSDGKFIVTTRTQCGNPALLGQARGALADIRALLGLEAPARSALPAIPDEELAPVLKVISADPPAGDESLPAVRIA
jgi:transcriptional regulator with XRE-family HTH domain